MRAGPAPGTAHEDVASGTLHFFARDPDDAKEQRLDRYLTDTKECHLDMKSVLEMAAPPRSDRPERYKLAPAHATRLRAFAEAALAEESDSDGPPVDEPGESDDDDDAERPIPSSSRPLPTAEMLRDRLTGAGTRL